MKWIKTYEPELKENYVEIHYHTVNQEVENFMELFQPRKELVGKKETEIRLIKPSELYYCEIVDRKCFAYLKDEVWSLEEGLQALCERYQKDGFVRISKSMLVNVYKIERLSANLNMRTQLFLENGEIVILNRGYRNEFFRTLNMLRLEREYADYS